MFEHKKASHEEHIVVREETAGGSKHVVLVGEFEGERLVTLKLGEEELERVNSQTCRSSSGRHFFLP